ncbi:hypothetical protein ACWGCW_38910 [Streptomyces sp. NPDC054933]
MTAPVAPWTAPLAEPAGPPAVGLLLGVGVALGVGEAVGVGVEPDPVPPPSRPLRVLPTPSGSHGFCDGVADGDGLAAGCDALSDLAAWVVALCVGLAAGWLLLDAPAFGVAEALADGDGVADGDAEGELSGDGLSDWLTQWSPLNGFFGSSSACASRGVSPMPIRTAVGIAARAIALPTGARVSSDLRGAAWRGPVLARGALLSFSG